MIQVILVDDEPLMLEWLKSSAQWANFDMQVCGAARNGKNALKLIQEKRPDLVITDIKMPLMDGLELIERVHSLCLPVTFVVLSGYDEFEYAQRAIRFNVVEYLLKPLSTQNLITCLTRLKELLSAKGSAQKRDALAGLAQNTQIIQRQVCTACMMAQSVQPVLLQQYLNLYKVSDHTRFQALFLTFPRTASMDTENFLRGWIDRNLPANTALIPWDQNQHYTLLLQAACEGPNREADEINLEKICGRLMNETRTMFGAVPIIGVSDALKGLASLPVCYQQSRGAALYFDPGYHKPVFSREKKKRTEEPDYPLQLEKHLHAAILCGDEEKALDSLTTILNHALSQNPASLVRLRSFCVNAVMSSMRLVQSVNAVADTAASALPEAVSELYHAPHPDDLVQYTRSTIRSLSRMLKEQNIPFIDRALKLVNGCLYEDHSLEEIAELLGKHPNYFSSVFKREMGMGYAEYVTRQRIARAKELLKNPRLQIQKIAFMVGYHDAKYFAYVFGKITGMRPSEYREHL